MADEHEIFNDPELNRLGDLAPGVDADGRATPPRERLSPKPEGFLGDGRPGGRVFFQNEVEDAQAEQIAEQMMRHAARGPLLLNRGTIIYVRHQDLGDGNRSITLRFEDGGPAVCIKGMMLEVEAVD